MTSIVILLALVLDRQLGETRHYHPLVGFGMLATRLAKKLHPGTEKKAWQQRAYGMFALILLLAPFMAIAVLLQVNTFLSWLTSLLVLYWAIGAQSLTQHACAVHHALLENKLDDARQKTARMVSRDTASMDQNDMSRATVESVLENGNDAIFAALFWFLLAGIPGVVAYRLVNTLDAMWGYKTPQWQYFGTFAARLDDLLNFIPARLTALSYALLGQYTTAMRCWMKQGHQWESPNAGPVMAAGAGALAIQLGGNAHYHGEIRQRQILGEGPIATSNDIARACQLVQRSIVLWLVVIAGVDYLA